ncbi:MAG: hypothetical protein NVSMB31_11330 [Vulcanimicrobiaceae bacterium]
MKEGFPTYQLALAALLAGAAAMGIGAALASAVGPSKRGFLAPLPLAWAALGTGFITLALAMAGEGNRSLLLFCTLALYGIFGYTFLAGLSRCLRVPFDRTLLAIPAVAGLAAIFVDWTANGPNRLYFPASILVTGTAIAGLIMLLRSKPRFNEPGNMCVASALALLMISGLRYIAVVTILGVTNAEPTLLFWIYNSIADIVLLVTLAVGAMLMITDRQQASLQATNAELAAAKSNLEIIANIDPLTGVSNRYAFYRCLQDLEGLDVLKGCLIMIDINNLKKINDEYGHVTGDTAICAVAERLRALIRNDDRIFRWGGDEFVALLFAVNPEGAAERISRFGSVTVSPNGDGKRLEISISWGVAPFGEGRIFEDVIKSADAQLYSARRALPENQV